MAKMKYKNYVELAAAFKSGELDRKKYTLILDNDNCNLRYTGTDMNQDEAFEHCQSLFYGNGYGDLEDAVIAAGIPCEWC